MRLIVLAMRFEKGAWRDWQHTCTESETNAVISASREVAFNRMRFHHQAYEDDWAGATAVFDVGLRHSKEPKEGDTRVYGVIVNDMLLGTYKEVEQHFRLSQNDQ